LRSRRRIIRGAMPQLAELKGQEIVVWLVHMVIDQTTNVMLTRLVDIEPNGIWIEGRDLASHLHNLTQSGIVPRMPLFFVPFAQIGWICGSADYPSLSETRLGLKSL